MGQQGAEIVQPVCGARSGTIMPRIRCQRRNALAAS